MNEQLPDSLEELPPVAAPSLWTDRPRPWILGLIFLLLVGNFFFQVQVYLLGAGLILPVLAGQVLGVFIPLLVISRNNGWNPIHDLRLQPTSGWLLAASVLLAAATLVPSSFLAEMSMRLFPSDPERIALFQQSLPRSVGGIMLTVLTVVVAGPLGEEIVFRGLLHRLASGFWDPVKATALTSLIFALVHIEPWLLLGLVGVGVALSFLFECTGSLLVCWVFHAAHNGIALILMYSSDEIITEPSEFAVMDFVWLGISLLVWALVGSWLWQVRKKHGDH